MDEWGTYRALRGAVVGAAGTGVMTAFMLAAQRAGLLGEAPPRKISERVLAGVARAWPSRRERLAISAASHLAFGVAAGTVFSLAAPRRLTRVRRVAVGALYGAAIWTTMYGYVLPALGLMPRPTWDRPRRPESMVAAHLIYGSVLGALL
jgi:hypothetical protein